MPLLKIHPTSKKSQHWTCNMNPTLEETHQLLNGKFITIGPSKLWFLLIKIDWTNTYSSVDLPFLLIESQPNSAYEAFDPLEENPAKYCIRPKKLLIWMKGIYSKSKISRIHGSGKQEVEVQAPLLNITVSEPLEEFCTSCPCYSGLWTFKVLFKKIILLRYTLHSV